MSAFQNSDIYFSLYNDFNVVLSEKLLCQVQVSQDSPENLSSKHYARNLLNQFRTDNIGKQPTYTLSKLFLYGCFKQAWKRNDYKIVTCGSQIRLHLGCFIHACIIMH